MKKFIFAMIILTSLTVSGCNFGKPAYSDVQLDNKSKAEPAKGESGNGQNANASAAQGEDIIAKAEREAGINGAQATPPQQNKERQLPAFFVPGVAEIKDLPRYKNSQIVNVQYGPINGIESANIMFESGDSVEKIGRFYETAFKSNGWTVVTNIKEPENQEYTLVKGKSDEALVRIKKDPQRGTTAVMLSRAQLPAGQSVTSTPLPTAPKTKNK
jgi:hypothetical protein